MGEIKLNNCKFTYSIKAWEQETITWQDVYYSSSLALKTSSGSDYNTTQKFSLSEAKYKLSFGSDKVWIVWFTNSKAMARTEEGTVISEEEVVRPVGTAYTHFCVMTTAAGMDKLNVYRK